MGILPPTGKASFMTASPRDQAVPVPFFTRPKKKTRGEIHEVFCAQFYGLYSSCLQPYKVDMATVPTKIADRLIAGIKRFQPILAEAKAGDKGEADTVTIIKEMLQDIFGYNKFTEVTSEYGIKGTYCDLAIKIQNKVQTLLEAKAIGIELKENHVKQIVDYAANEGVSWVILTNGVRWQIYKITFEKPISHELVVDIDFLTLKPKSDFEPLYLWCKEAWGESSALDEFEARKQALSRFLIGAVILSDPVIDVIRKELRRVSLLSKAGVDVRIESEQIEQVILLIRGQRVILDRDLAALYGVTTGNGIWQTVEKGIN